jgi:hypothetical protein
VVPANSARHNSTACPFGVQLESVLAGVTGARQQHVDAGHLRGHHRVVLERHHLGPLLVGHQRGEDGLGGRALHRDKCGLRRLVDDLGVECRCTTG